MFIWIVLLIFFLILYFGTALTLPYVLFRSRLIQPNDKSVRVEDKYIILGKAKNGKVYKVATIGDSLAQGNGTPSITQSASYQFSQKNFIQDYDSIEYSNFAGNGATSYQVLKDQSVILPNNYYDALFISCGSNDIIKFWEIKISWKFREMIELIAYIIKQKNINLVVWTSIPNFMKISVLWFPLNYLLQKKVNQYNKEIKKVCQDNGFVFVDLSKVKTTYSPDFIHPDKEGYKQVASAIEKELGLY